MRRIVVLAAGLLLAAHSPAPAQLPAAAQAVQAPAGPAPDATLQPGAGGSAGASTGLPARQAPPRTLRAYWHVFVAFALAWALLFGYVLVLARRLGRVDRDIQRLGQIGG